MSIEDCKELAIKRNGRCLSTEYINNKTKMEWQCSNKHHRPWWAIYSSIKRGSWCPYCSRNARKNTIDDCKKLAAKKNGKCLSTEYVNVSTKMKWQCEIGHVWYAIYDKVRSKTWCPECARNARKNTIGDCKKLAAKKNGKCLSTEYINNKTKMKWQCKEGHVFESRYINIISDKWCPKCYNKRRSFGIKLTIEYCREIAKNRNGRCLSNRYIDVNTKMKWQCKKGHIWRATTDSINQGTWCPACGTGKTQYSLLQIIKTIFSKYDVLPEFNDFDWLYTDKGRKQSIDIYVPKLKLAIEYDGEQHFMPVKFGNYSGIVAREKYKRTVELDEMKNRKIKEHPLDVKYFIRFDYTEKNRLNREYVLQRLIDSDIPIK